MRVFCDVGAHDGQTLEEVLTHDFDRVYAFEPMPEQFAHLAERFGQDRRLRLLNCGLSDRSGRRMVYGTNDAMEASVYPQKADVDATVATECDFLEAAAFFRRFTDETVIVKLNCEGSEVAILANLIESGEIWKVANVMVDFDVRKIPGMEDQEGMVLDRLAAIGFDRVVLSEHVMLGETHQDRIANWLVTAAA